MIEERSMVDGPAPSAVSRDAGELLRPAEFARRLLATLAASEGRRKRRKRNTTPDSIGLGIKHDLLEGSIDNIIKKTGRSREQAIAELSKHNPQGRLVAPSEVADTVLWLCGEGAGAITGQAIAVAGGEV